MKAKITVLGGDGIGPEVTGEAVRVLEAVAARYGHEFEFVEALIGGAAINRRFGRRILFLDEGGQPYEPGVFYCKDAFEGLETMDRLIDPARRPALLEQVRREADMEMGRAAQKPEARPGERARDAGAIHRA